MTRRTDKWPAIPRHPWLTGIALLVVALAILIACGTGTGSRVPSSARCRRAPDAASTSAVTSTSTWAASPRSVPMHCASAMRRGRRADHGQRRSPGVRDRSVAAAVAPRSADSRHPLARPPALEKGPKGIGNWVFGEKGGLPAAACCPFRRTPSCRSPAGLFPGAGAACRDGCRESAPRAETATARLRCRTPGARYWPSSVLSTTAHCRSSAHRRGWW